MTVELLILAVVVVLEVAGYRAWRRRRRRERDRVSWRTLERINEQARQ